MKHSKHTTATADTLPSTIELPTVAGDSRLWPLDRQIKHNNVFEGKFDGLWRAYGRIPSKQCGSTFTAYGFDVSSYYKREEDSERVECAWIFDGVGEDEIIGDFGLSGGGPAGLELDRYDIELGTPHNAYLLTRSVGHTNLMLQANEEIHFSVRGYYGEAPKIHRFAST